MALRLPFLRLLVRFLDCAVFAARRARVCSARARPHTQHQHAHTHAPRTHTSQCSRLEYTLLDISDDGYLSLMTEGGDTKDDLTLPSGTGARAFVACGSGARPAPRAPPRSPLPPYARIRCAVMQMRPTSWLS